jgi:DnaA family protein
MAPVAEQLPLPLIRHAEWTFESFYEGPNRETVAHLKSFAKGSKTHPFIVLMGGKGQGKSHLLNAVSEESHSHQERSLVLPLEELKSSGPQILDDLDHLDCLCLDDIDQVFGERAWDLALMMLLQERQRHGKPFLVSLSQSLGDSKECLPDLSSRLTGGLTLSLKSLGDEDLLSVLIDRARRLGMELTPAVGRYLVTHAPRNLDALIPLMERLDKASLASQRRLTIPFIKAHLIDLAS